MLEGNSGESICLSRLVTWIRKLPKVGYCYRVMKKVTYIECKEDGTPTYQTIVRKSFEGYNSVEENKNT